jgi:uncharacterized protein with NRDE domain
MCLALVALDAHPQFALVLAANRDEFHARPASAARWGQAAPFTDILAGRDLDAGGTWLGIRRDGRWALLTNVREGGRFDASAPSRGDIVPALLNASDPLPVAAHAFAGDTGTRYNGFNVLAGDGDGAFWVSNRGGAPTAVARGVHGVSNALLDTPWPKLTRTRSAFAAWCARNDTDFAPLFAALADRTQAPDDALPATGVPHEWEQLLSSPFIVSERYGTRCSTIVAIGHDGAARFVERSFDAQGSLVGEAAFAFTIARGTPGG